MPLNRTLFRNRRFSRLLSFGLRTTCTRLLLFCIFAGCTSSRTPNGVAKVPNSPSAAEAANPPTGYVGDVVVFPSPEIEFIAGPQLKSGSTLNPTPWFDQNAITRGLQFGDAFPADPPGLTPMSGTVAVQKNSPNLVGSGTKFVSEFPGAANQYYVIITDDSGIRRSHYLKSVQDDTHLTLSAPWVQSSSASRVVSKTTGDIADQYINSNYYDQALIQYINYYRTGDQRFLRIARKIVDSWWRAPFLIAEGNTGIENTIAPRHVGLSGMMLRALDGRPELWPWITSYARYMFDIWIGQRVTYPALYYGAREGGYMLLYAAQLGRVHPDQNIRREFRDKALNAAVNWYARVQFPDGSWRWGDDAWVGNATQPFHVGILLEGLIAVHRLTNDSRVGQSIVKGATALYQIGYNPKGWRAMYYLVHGNYADGTKCDKGCGAAAGTFPPSDIGQVSEARQLNATCIHAFGYAFQLSSDPRFKEWGDEILDATFGSRDKYRGLAASRPKEYDESYRSTGKYLIWRLTKSEVSATVAQPSQQPSPLPVEPVPSSNVAAVDLVNAALKDALSLSTATAISEPELEMLTQAIEGARQTITNNSSRFIDPNLALSELKAALTHVNTALAFIKGNNTEDARLRITWAAARLKRAAERTRQVGNP